MEVLPLVWTIEDVRGVVVTAIRIVLVAALEVFPAGFAVGSLGLGHFRVQELVFLGPAVLSSSGSVMGGLCPVCLSCRAGLSLVVA